MDKEEAKKLDKIDKDTRELKDVLEGERHVKSLDEQAHKGVLENTIDTILGENDVS